jgi:hypothetical protein
MQLKWDHLPDLITREQTEMKIEEWKMVAEYTCEDLANGVIQNKVSYEQADSLHNMYSALAKSLEGNFIEHVKNFYRPEKEFADFMASCASVVKEEYFTLNKVVYVTAQGIQGIADHLF